MAEAQVVQSDDTSKEFVAYLLVKMIDDAEDHPKRNRKQILDLYAECAMAVRNPGQRRAAFIEKAKAKAAEKAGEHL